jgi:hypothetical protein
VNRMLKGGGYSLPGMEVAHSVAAITGALGYALWLSERRPEGAVAATLGLLSMLTSTGRWDVVAYGLWCLALEAVFASPAAPRRFLASSLRLFVLLAVFFVAHGELLSKVESLQTVAELPAGVRANALNTAVALGFSADSTDSMPLEVAAPRRSCQRWDDATERSNRAFLTMSRIARVFALYFAGPFAAFDKSNCERRPVVREVIFYWPLKLARLVHLRDARPSYTVDPFIDIGIPYNNYTLFYPFLGKFGGAVGLLAWLVTALMLRVFVSTMFSGAAGLQGMVAGIGPFAIAVRGLWTNAFFDGSMVVYGAVALAGFAMAHLNRQRSSVFGLRGSNMRLPS